MARIANELIERIKREVPMAEVCREYGIELKPQGKDLIGHCPFHDDRTPSFSVTPGKNLWNCLAGCGGGDNIQLVMRWEKVSFRYAAEKLLARLGGTPAAAAIKTRAGTAHEILTVPGEGLSDAQLMGIVADFYHSTFCNQSQAMAYLRVRGLAKNTSYEAMKINLRVKLDDQSPSGSELYHQDNVDMNAAKSRETFIRAACSETAIKEEILKRDLSRLLLKLEELQEENIRRAMEPKGPVLPGMSEAERDEALALLRDPKLLERILARR